jgi:hypothetical protein
MSRRVLVGVAACAVALGGTSLLSPVAASGASTAATSSHGQSMAVHKVGTSTVKAGTGQTPAAADELRPDGEAGEALKATRNRSPRSRARDTRVTPPPSGVLPTQNLLVQNGRTGYQGINHFDQRRADGGNQYSLIPPDQALCSNGTQTFEGVNNGFRIFSGSGAPLTDTISANQFLWNDHEIDQSTGIASHHQVGDPSCVYDAGSNRFFLTVYDLVGNDAGDLLGPSSVDIAVSPAGSAIGTWTVYQMDTTDNGGDNCPCFGDYPHLGTDTNGLWITTNEFSTLGDGFNGAQVYGIAKSKLVDGTAQIPGVHFSTSGRDTTASNGPLDGYSLAPAVSAGTAYARNTMYFLSSDADAGDTSVVSHQILQWGVRNTSALASNPSSLSLDEKAIGVNGYFVPPLSEQKAGPTPLADCLNLTTCAKVVLGTPDKFKEYEYALDSNDTRMLQSAYANGRLWGSLDTAVDQSDGTTRAGIAYYVVNPTATTTASTVVKQGTVSVPGENITYPALGVTSAGRMAMSVTLVGKDYYPSHAYLTGTDAPRTVLSSVKIAGAGVGPDDSFGGYRGFAYNHARWGDYSAASVVGNQVYLASEYIAQSCNLATYQSTDFTCGNTRTALANWSTHVAAVTP